MIADERHAGRAQPLERGDGLRELHQRERPLLHPRAAATPTRRSAASASARACLGGAGDLLADDRAHRAAHEPEVHDADRRPAGRRSCRCPRRRRRACPVASWAAATRSGYGFWSTNPSGSTDWRPASRSSNVPVVEEQLEPRRRPTGGSGGRTFGQTRWALSSCLLNSISLARRALRPEVGRVGVAAGPERRQLDRHQASARPVRPLGRAAIRRAARGSVERARRRARRRRSTGRPR